MRDEPREVDCVSCQHLSALGNFSFVWPKDLEPDGARGSPHTHNMTFIKIKQYLHLRAPVMRKNQLKMACDLHI